MDRVLPTPAATPFRPGARRSRLHTWPEEELLAAAHQGDDAALGELWVRHRAAARRLARSYTRTAADADELTDAAFERLVTALRNGGGPQRSFRAYLFTVVRRVATERPRWWPGPEAPAALEFDVALDDHGIDLAERELVTRAFATLPDRQQLVLWQTAVEDRPPREVSDQLGLSANAAAALAYRARERLRQAYLQAHVAASSPPDGCKAFASHLGAYVRQSLSTREQTAVTAHLDDCEGCADLLAELTDVDATLRRAIVPWWAALGAGGLATATGRAGLLRGRGRRSRRLTTRAARHGVRVLAGSVALGTAAVAAAVTGLVGSPPAPRQEGTVRLEDTATASPRAPLGPGGATVRPAGSVPSSAGPTGAPAPVPSPGPVLPTNVTAPAAPTAPPQPWPPAPSRIPVRARRPAAADPATAPTTAPTTPAPTTAAPTTTTPPTTAPPTQAPPTTAPPTTTPPTTTPPTTTPPTTTPPTTTPPTTDPPAAEGLRADLTGTPFDAVLVTNHLAADADHLVLTIRSPVRLPDPIDAGDWTCKRHGEHDVRCTLPRLAAGAAATPVRFDALPLVVASVWAGGDDRPD